jgi:hypothetical protein
VQTEEWRTQCQELQEVIQGASRKLAVGETRAVPTKFRHLTYSAVERQFNHALGKQLPKCSLLFCMGVRLRREHHKLRIFDNWGVEENVWIYERGKTRDRRIVYNVSFSKNLGQLKQEGNGLDMQHT